MQDYSEVLSNADVSAREKKQTTVTVNNCEVHRLFLFFGLLFFLSGVVSLGLLLSNGSSVLSNFTVK